MTPLFLQDALVTEVGEVLESLQTASENPFKVFPQNIPPRKEDKDYSIFPFCRVVLGDGEDSGEESTQDIVLVLAVRDPGEDMQGYRDVANAVQRLRERFNKRPEVGRCFSIRSPIRWVLPEKDDAYPVYYGALLLTADIPQIDIDSEYTGQE